jgi:starch phosphorylase
MAEALETWSEELVMRKLPRIYIILKQINERLMNELRILGLANNEANELAIIKNSRIRMANLSVFGSHTVNGVSALHSEIIKQSIFKGFYKVSPEKFINITNGIAHRRWLNQSNPLLSTLLNEKINKDYYKNASMLKNFEQFKNDIDVLDALEEVKYLNKCSFAKYLSYSQKIDINPNTRFDVQVKRFHEYKRQLLNALKIVYLITQLEENIDRKFTPQTFIFGGKAASGYYVAKQVIELINHLSIFVDENPEIKKKLNVVFIEDYNVSVAEKLIPATEVSEQISLAGKEASGTGNMKFMINGALTFGTMDGANVEISQNVGLDNIFIFGMNTIEVNDLWRRGYYAHDFYNKSPRIQAVINRLQQGFNGKSFSHITDYLLNNYPINDPYMCLADFDSYLDIHEKMDNLYQNKRKWNQMSLINISNAGIFSADRSIDEYASKIWKLKRIK